MNGNTYSWSSMWGVIADADDVDLGDTIEVADKNGNVKPVLIEAIQYFEGRYGRLKARCLVRDA